MMLHPLVSIIIPVFNGANYLKEAIDSALAQTYQNIEILVVNDGSNDNGATECIALSYGDKIRYFAKENGGVSTALNMGIENMKGEYFSWLSHDDVYTPDKIASHIAMLNEENKDSIFVCGSAFIDKDSKPFPKKSRPLPSGYYPYDKMLSVAFRRRLPGGCRLLIPKKHFDRFGLFNESLRFMQDTEMWYRFLTGKISFILHPDNLGVLSRIHNEQVTVTKKHLYRQDLQAVGPALVKRLVSLPEKNFSLLKEYMYLCCRENNVSTANLAYAILHERKHLSLASVCKFWILRLYGVVRPLLVKIYYFLLMGIKIKK